MLPQNLVPLSVVKIAVIDCSTALVTICQTTWYHNSFDLRVKLHHHLNLKYHQGLFDGVFNCNIVYFLQESFL